MTPGVQPRLDRRHVRRAETIAEVVDVAIEVMGENGVAGLSLGEVARRMGIRPPSLYVYFDSKNAVYDAVFARGWQEILPAMEAVPMPDGTTEDLPGYLLRVAQAFVGWALAHPVHTQLMVWRPVPGYEPSAATYEWAVQAFTRGQAVFERLVELGLLRDDVPVSEIFRVWTVLTSGVITQQLANAPTEGFDEGSFTGLLGPLVEMYGRNYGVQAGPGRPRKAAPPTKTSTSRTPTSETPTSRTPTSRTTATRRSHADQR
jgi:AcrR family transcriptional regulator